VVGNEAGDAMPMYCLGLQSISKIADHFPRTEGQIPIYYNYFHTGRPATSDSDRFYRSAYIDLSIYPKFPFGYGLSYTDSSYSDITLNKRS
jgi:beta-glucosidase